ncbi:MAG: metal-sulfur cluster biosynthetic enzyme [candidate division Zixibacteria bacterium 4484_95]|nr:MAG: metal-sulfur cluster biosynthetic enzyme [candidate division Zixibacteria bacterium 4484_95]RKX21116.1 MAG: metal-sulfur cluster biosynthetic enzyme [candidate division Zixibacteria bacterium]
MAENISEEEVRKVVGQVKHPVIDCTLVELGIVKDITVEDKKAIVTMVFPSPNIPIKDDLVNSLKEALNKLDVEVEVRLGVMDHEEVEKFLDMEKENWKGGA